MVIDKEKKTNIYSQFKIEEMMYVLRKTTMNKKTNHSAKYDQHLNANTSWLYGDF